MSSRRRLDAYDTDCGLTRALLRMHSIAGTVLEPCAGRGHIAQVLAEVPGVTVLTNDVDPTTPATLHLDATQPDLWQRMAGRVEWVITNPPFDQAEQILPHAMQAARVGVAFLLRLTYAEPTNGRAAWLQEHADRQVWQAVVNPRPRFRAGEINPKTGRPFGTDSATVAWFMWRVGWSWRDRNIRPPFAYVTDWPAL